jgi:hypothetical protein
MYFPRKKLAPTIDKRLVKRTAISTGMGVVEVYHCFINYLPKGKQRQRIGQAGLHTVYVLRYGSFASVLVRVYMAML